LVTAKKTHMNPEIIHNQENDLEKVQLNELGPVGPEEKRVHLHTKIRTSTYAALLIYMREANLQHLGEVVDRILGEYLDAARVKAGKKRRAKRRTTAQKNKE
jgi:hypothetical protein